MAKHTGSKATVSRSYVDFTDLNGDGSLVIYQRAGSKKGAYTARISVLGENGYTIRSTRCRKKNDAIAAAKGLYQNALVRAAQGLNQGIGNFEQVYKQWVEHLRMTDAKSDKKLKQHIREGERYLYHFFKDYKFEEIDERIMDRYWLYRIGYWGSKRGKRQIREHQNAVKNRRRTKNRDGRGLTSLGNVKLLPAEKSLEIERGNLNEFWRWCVRNKFCARAIDIRIRDKRIKRAKDTGVIRRAHFTVEEWRRLYTYMRKWVVGKEEGAVALNSRNAFYRRLVRDLVLFSGNTGLRVGEMRELKWSHVSELQSDAADAKGNVMTGVRIRVSHNTKTGYREVVGRRSALSVLNRRRKETDFTADDDFIFSGYRGEMMGYHGKTFNKVLEALDLKTDALGQQRSLYSCRHTYITRQLEKKKISLHTLSKQTGTSIQNIERIYGHHTVMDEKDNLLA